MANFWAKWGSRKSGRKSQGGHVTTVIEKENQDPPNSEAQAALGESAGTVTSDCYFGSKQDVVSSTQLLSTKAQTGKPAVMSGAEQEEAGFCTVNVQYKSTRTDFKVRTHLAMVKGIGSGAYGVVAKLEDPATGKGMAVKKITRAFDDLADGKRILREVTLLRYFKHDNIVGLVDMYMPGGLDFEDIYIATELMEMDLTRVIRSGEPLLEDHHRWITYQTLLGVLYIHSAGVVHRDLKPSNILVNRDCSVKICDFGLSRGYEPAVSQKGARDVSAPIGQKMTEYVVTRYYRAPEVVLLASEYGPPIDVWSVGCILCELIGRKPVFKGKDHLDQIEQIISVMGSPQEEDISWLKSSPYR